MNYVYNFTGSASGDDSVHDLRIMNRNRFILSKANEIVNDYKILGLSFGESDSKVIRIVCDMIKND